MSQYPEIPKPRKFETSKVRNLKYAVLPFAFLYAAVVCGNYRPAKQGHRLKANRRGLDARRQLNSLNFKL